jgi:type III pantothenate kinase
MIIVGDIGNTETKVCLIDKSNKIIKKIIIKTKDINNNSLSVLLTKFKLSKINIKKVLFCSVVPKAFNQIKKIFYQKLKIKIYELKDLDLKKMINIKVNYKQIGSDRLANALSVIGEKKNYIILDFGTATTFDVLVKKNYYGGVIAPGVKLSLKTLSDKASLIPNINLKKPKKVIGQNTINAVRSGFFWGYAGLIDNIIKLIKKETRKSFKVIITGGFSNLFKKSINTKVYHNKDITINGLIKISNLIK